MKQQKIISKSFDDFKKRFEKANFEQIDTTDKQFGFFDLPQKETCNHPEHNPPSHMVIPQGKGYRHVCPNCSATQIIIPSQHTL